MERRRMPAACLSFPASKATRSVRISSSEMSCSTCRAIYSLGKYHACVLCLHEARIHVPTCAGRGSIVTVEARGLLRASASIRCQLIARMGWLVSVASRSLYEIKVRAGQGCSGQLQHFGTGLPSCEQSHVDFFDHILKHFMVQLWVQ